MSNNFKKLNLPSLVGFGFMVCGWYISIVKTGSPRFEPNTFFTPWALCGLILIILGAYMPEIWKKFGKG